MVLLSIVAVWLAVALVLGVTIGRSIRRADAAELGVRPSRGVDRSATTPALETVDRPLVRQAA